MTDVADYLASLPEDRRRTISAVRDAILAALPAGFVEGVQYGMLGYMVPLDRYPASYNGQPLCYLALAAQKRYCSLYLMNVYGEREAAFRAAYAASGKRLDMGKSCVRFRTAQDLALEVITRQIAWDTVESFIQYSEAARHRAARG
jgi:hypothetical protein